MEYGGLDFPHFLICLILILNFICIYLFRLHFQNHRWCIEYKTTTKYKVYKDKKMIRIQLMVIPSWNWKPRRFGSLGALRPLVIVTKSLPGRCLNSCLIRRTLKNALHIKRPESPSDSCMNATSISSDYVTRGHPGLGNQRYRVCFSAHIMI